MPKRSRLNRNALTEKSKRLTNLRKGQKFNLTVKVESGGLFREDTSVIEATVKDVKSISPFGHVVKFESKILEGLIEDAEKK